MASAAETVTSPAVNSEHGKPWRPSTAGWAVRLGLLAALFLLLIWTVSAVSAVWASLISLALIYAIIGLSLNIVMGYVGQVSLGHHAFVGLSAFVAALMVTEKGQSFGVALLIACATGGLSAGLLGLIALRIKGLYLALITLTYGFVAVNSFFEIPALTGGGQGLEAPRPSLFGSDVAFAYLCMGFVALVLFVDWRLLASKVGRGILAVKESEAVAASYAVNVTSYKVIAFILSGVFAGLAGALFAFRNQVVVASDFNFGVALLWVLMVVVGGLGNRVGVVIGSMFFALFTELVGLIAPLEHFLTNTFQREAAEFEGLIGALLALLTIILHPGGISDQVAPLVRWFSGKKFSFHPEEAGPVEEKEPGRLKQLLGRGGKATTAPAETDATPEPVTGSLTDALGHATGAASEGAAPDPAVSARDEDADASPTDSEETGQIPSAAGDDTAQIPATVDPKPGGRGRGRKSKAKSKTDEAAGGDS